MVLPSLENFNFQQKRVFVRCDFNVPLQAGKVLDVFRIDQTLPTINYLKRNQAKIILASHLSQGPKSSDFKLTRRYASLRPFAQFLSFFLKEKVVFVEHLKSPFACRKIKRLKPSQICLLENLRLFKGEEENSPQFASLLARLADVYVNEAFSVCHRRHASLAALPALLPHFAGFHLEKEVAMLSRLMDNPARPLVVVIGGTKLASKIKLIEKFLKTADHLLLGGRVVDAVLRVKGIVVGRPWPDKAVVEMIEKINLTSPKIHLPVDVVAAPQGPEPAYLRQTAPGMVRKEEDIFDLGEEAIRNFAQIISSAKTIFWAGPIGLVENERFQNGTLAVAQAIIENKDAFNLVGGGDTVAALKRFGLLNRFGHISTGGGAMLNFLAGESMPGLEALQA